MSKLRITRGQRDAKDIIDAAIAQGWRTRRAGSHLRLIPPNGVPVGVSGTPSDVNYRRQMVRQMRKSGFIWPWPPQGAPNGNGTDCKEGEEMPTIGELVGAGVMEVWRPIDHCSVAEISNGGRCRKISNGKIIEPDANGMITLTDDQGRVRQKSSRALVRIHFGHPPIPHVIPETAAVSHRSNEVLTMLAEPEVDPQGVSEAITEAQEAFENEAPQEENNNQDQEDAVSIQAERFQMEVDHVASDYAYTPDPEPEEQGWADVHLDGIVEGYQINAAGDVRSPAGKVLTPNLQGSQIWVQLRRSDKPGHVPRSYRVDRLVLSTFSGPAPDASQDVPIHRNGDTLNCHLENLEWGSFGDQQRLDEAKAKAEPAPPAAVPDKPEPQEPEPEPEVEVEVMEVDPDPQVAESEPYEHQDYVDKVVAQAPSFGEPDEEAPDEKRKRRDRERKAVRRRSEGAKVRAKVSPKKAPPAKKTPTGGIERLRLYRLGGVTLTVDNEGNADLSKAKGLTPAELAAVAMLSADAVEMNRLMGLE